MMEWDVVLFADEDGEWSLGKVETFRAGDDACVCQPLYEEASTGLWLESHARPPRSVRLADVRAVVEADFAQRMAPDRVSNPHGEHAEDFWDIIDAARLPPTRDASSRCVIRRRRLASPRVRTQVSNPRGDASFIISRIHMYNSVVEEYA